MSEPTGLHITGNTLDPQQNHLMGKTGTHEMNYYSFSGHTMKETETDTQQDSRAYYDRQSDK